MAIAGLVSGALLLVLGKRLFWLFVAIVGFFAGMSLAGRFSPPDSGLVLIVGLGLGAIGALLAVGLQRVAIFVAGFLGGGYLLVTALSLFGIDASLSWLPFLIGGVLGAALLALVFDWALVFLSSLTGAVLIAHYAGIGAPYTMLVVAGLFIGGVILQQSLQLRVS